MNFAEVFRRKIKLNMYQVITKLSQEWRGKGYLCESYPLVSKLLTQKMKYE